MKCLIFLCGFLVVALATQGLNDNWESFKQKFGKKYAHPTVEQQRRSIWESNMKYVERHNQQAANGQHSFTLAENQFADLTTEEFAALYNGLRIHKADTFNFHKPGPLSDIPDELDWRTKGYVTGVKDQEQCGSCWAFSAIASLEGQNFKKTGKLVALSEQNLVDCDDLDSGCDGGLMDTAFEFIKKQKGIDTEAAYPYTGEEGEKCLFDATKVGATVSGYVDVKWGSEKDLQDAVANVGPISVAIDAGHSSFQLYAKGVYYEPDCSSSDLDHGVTAVGYGKEDGKDFWLVKNSWGTSWGEEGYIKMARNKNNHCGIATNASYPLV